MRSRFIILTILTSLLCQTVWAQNSPPISCEVPMDLELLEANSPLTTKNVVTDRTISQEALTVPSLWWAKEQFDPFGGRLITNWIAYPKERRIDLVVNRQLWSLLNYMDRYRFVNKFGTVARDYQYNLRVFDRQQKCLAIYSCNFNTNPNQCEIHFEPSGRTGLQVDPLNEGNF
ncbi:hypothetical protein NIES593_15395 [Hydrococcus rivularis NIES-593]|uniref:Uncharacterized protein n=2 Tax=Hydrococcus TaxID=1616833 RepID=A0A1U7HDF3_9CYAN|nr:hypothetical protein NIES593_15395 [Hydrococcus rivularis NIES-593]